MLLPSPSVLLLSSLFFPSLALSFFSPSIYLRQPLFIAAMALLMERRRETQHISTFTWLDCRLSEGFMSVMVLDNFKKYGSLNLSLGRSSCNWQSGGRYDLKKAAWPHCVDCSWNIIMLSCTSSLASGSTLAWALVSQTVWMKLYSSNCLFLCQELLFVFFVLFFGRFGFFGLTFLRSDYRIECTPRTMQNAIKGLLKQTVF